jgi:hypothetical protein
LLQPSSAKDIFQSSYLRKRELVAHPVGRTKRSLSTFKTSKITAFHRSKNVLERYAVNHTKYSPSASKTSIIEDVGLIS